MLVLRTSLLTAALAVGLSSGAPAATEWVLSTGLPDSNFFAKNYMEFIKEVEKESGGELKIKYAGNNSLVKRDAIRRAIQTNQVQLGEVDFVNLGNENPVFLFDSIPGLVLDYDEAWKLMESVRPYAQKLFAERGLRIIGYAPWPGQGFFSKKPIQSLADFKDIKLRIYSETTKTMGDILGARPTILPAAEVPQAFASGLIEAMFTSPATGVISQAWDNTKFLTYVGGIHSKQSLVVGEDAFKALSPKLQKVVLDAGENATKRGWKMSEEDNGEMIKILEKNGMKVIQAWPELKTKMEKEIGSKLIADWRKSAPPDAVAVLDDYLKKVKR